MFCVFFGLSLFYSKGDGIYNKFVVQGFTLCQELKWFNTEPCISVIVWWFLTQIHLIVYVPYFELLIIPSLTLAEVRCQQGYLEHHQELAGSAAARVSDGVGDTSYIQTSQTSVPAHVWLRPESSWAHWENPIENPLTFATLLWVLKLYCLLFKKEFHESGEKSWNCGWTASLIGSLSEDFCGSKFEAELQYQNTQHNGVDIKCAKGRVQLLTARHWNNLFKNKTSQENILATSVP